MMDSVITHVVSYVTVNHVVEVMTIPMTCSSREAWDGSGEPFDTVKIGKGGH